MNEMLAENRFVMTKELFTEGARRVWAESSGKTIKKLLAVLALLWLGLSAYTLMRGGGLGFPVVELLVLALVVFWTAYWMPRRRAQRAYRSLEERGAADGERTVCFYAERLELETGGQQISIAYADLAQILTSKNLLILIDGNRTGVMIKRDAFTRGTEDEVLQLIQKERAI